MHTRINIAHGNKIERNNTHTYTHIEPHTPNYTHEYTIHTYTSHIEQEVKPAYSASAKKIMGSKKYNNSRDRAIKNKKIIHSQHTLTFTGKRRVGSK